MPKLHEIVINHVFKDKILAPLLEDGPGAEALSVPIDINRFFNKVYLKNPLDRAIKSVIVGLWKEMPEFEDNLRALSNSIGSEDYSSVVKGGSIDFNALAEKSGIDIKVIKLLVAKCEVKFRNNLYKAIQRGPEEFYSFMNETFQAHLSDSDINLVTRVIMSDAGVDDRLVDEIVAPIPEEDGVVVFEPLSEEESDLEGEEGVVVWGGDVGVEEGDKGDVEADEGDKGDVEVEEGDKADVEVVEFTPLEEGPVGLDTARVLEALDQGANALAALLKEHGLATVVRGMVGAQDSDIDTFFHALAPALATVDIPVSKEDIAALAEIMESSTTLRALLRRFLYLTTITKTGAEVAFRSLPPEYIAGMLNNVKDISDLRAALAVFGSVTTTDTKAIASALDPRAIGGMLKGAKTAGEVAFVLHAMGEYSSEIAREVLKHSGLSLEAVLEHAKGLEEASALLKAWGTVEPEITKGALNKDLVARVVGMVGQDQGLKPLGTLIKVVGKLDPEIAVSIVESVPEDIMDGLISGCRNLGDIIDFIKTLQDIDNGMAGDFVHRLRGRENTETIYYLIMRSGVKDIKRYVDGLTAIGSGFSPPPAKLMEKALNEGGTTVFLKMYAALPPGMKDEMVGEYRQLLELRIHQFEEIVGGEEGLDVESLSTMPGAEVAARVREALEKGGDVGYVLTTLDTLKSRVKDLGKALVKGVSPDIMAVSIQNGTEDFDTLVIYIQVLFELNNNYAVSVVRALDTRWISSLSETIHDLFHLIGYLQYFEEIDAEKARDILQSTDPMLVAEKIKETLDIPLITDALVYLEGVVKDMGWRHRFATALDIEDLGRKVKGKGDEEIIYLMTSLYRLDKKVGMLFAAGMDFHTLTNNVDNLTLSTAGPVLINIHEINPKVSREIVARMGPEYFTAILEAGPGGENLRYVNDLLNALKTIDPDILPSVISVLDVGLIKSWIEDDKAGGHEVLRFLRVLMPEYRDQAKGIFSRMSPRKMSQMLRKEDDISVLTGLAAEFWDMDCDIYDAFVTTEVKRNLLTRLLDCMDVERFAHAVWYIYNTDRSIIKPILSDLDSIKSRFIRSDNMGKLVNALELMADINRTFVVDVIRRYGTENIADRLIEAGDLKKTAYILSKLSKFMPDEAANILHHYGDDGIVRALMEEESLPTLSYVFYELGSVSAPFMSRVVEKLDWKKIGERMYGWRDLKEIGFFISSIRALNQDIARQLVDSMSPEIWVMKVKDWKIARDVEYFLGIVRTVDERRYRELSAHI